jgi:hypothetical protein
VLAMWWNLLSQERGLRREQVASFHSVAGQLPDESSPEASDHPYRAQRHLIVKMMVVRAGRRAPYLGAARDDQP